MQTLAAWLIVAALPIATLPWSLWWLARASRRLDWPLAAALAVGLSFGGLTLLMFWTSLLGSPFDALLLTALALLAHPAAGRAATPAVQRRALSPFLP